MIEFDPGPTKALARHLDDMPSYADKRELFWYDWGPIFYRGRLNGSARLLGIASDPGPTERIAGRTLVGDAGQRVQGFLSKLGLTRSYVLVNAYAYALHPSRAPDARPLLSQNDHRRWRNKLYDMVSGSDLEAIVAFGGEAQAALDLWDDRPDVPVFELPHPSSRNPNTLVNRWRAGIDDLRAIVTPDSDGDPLPPNYGTQVPRGGLCAHPAARPALRGAGVVRRRLLGADRETAPQQLGVAARERSGAHAGVAGPAGAAA